MEFCSLWSTSSKSLCPRNTRTSLIKDGKLLEAFNGSEIRVYAISDVEGDSIATIGSGLGDCHRAKALAVHVKALMDA